jgi:hypothetical protein
MSLYFGLFILHSMNSEEGERGGFYLSTRYRRVMIGWSDKVPSKGPRRVEGLSFWPFKWGVCVVDGGTSRRAVFLPCRLLREDQTLF